MKEDGKLIEIILKGFIYIQQNKKHRAEVLQNIHNTLLGTVQQLNNTGTCFIINQSLRLKFI